MSILLLGADYYGTLAAVRCLGERGITVFVADEKKHARALFSKYVRERHVHPPLSEPDALIEWLVHFGETHDDTVLYPTNDHTAWLFAVHDERLRKAFRTYSPGEDAVLGLLDKKRLSDACRAVGIDLPKTALCENDDDAERLAEDVKYPLLVKPRTQIYLESGIKGMMVSSPGELGGELTRFNELVKFGRVITERQPDIARPLLQEYLTAAETSIFSVSGFIDGDGEMITRAAMKVLQRPRKVGIGLCFESRTIEPEIEAQLRALCKHLGYKGAFEVEYIADGARRLMIDFNPRFFSQMAFDIARHSPIPLFAYHAARGENDPLRRAMARARAWEDDGRHVYVHKTMLDMVLTLQGLSGEMSRAEVRKWKAWLHEHEGHVTDAVRADGDVVPALVDTASWVEHFARHPRSFVKSFVLNR